MYWVLHVSRENCLSLSHESFKWVQSVRVPFATFLKRTVTDKDLRIPLRFRDYISITYKKVTYSKA